MKRVFLSGALAVMLVQFAQAQSFFSVRRERNLIVSFGTGNSSYFGDVKGSNSKLDLRPNITAGAQMFLNSRLSVRGDATWFQLAGSDANNADPYLKRRNLSFRSSNVELAVTGAISFFKNGNRFYRRPGFNVYGFGGVGALYFNPKAQLNGTWYALEPLHTEGKSYSRIAIVIPFGLGARIRLGPYTNLAIEGGYRKTFTDYLDDVSSVYPDPSKLSSPTAVALSNRYITDSGVPDPSLGKVGGIRGNPKNKDSYMLINIKLEYYLPMDFQLFNKGPKRNTNTFNRRRNSSFYRYKRGGGLK